MASNNWVISGKHTATGMPMLANDPHLGTAIPSFWTLQELVWEDKFLIGGSLPGVPMIGIGRSKNVSWGQTSPLCDASDLWKETISEDGLSYFVDGEWRPLQIETHEIKVKGQDPVKFDVKLTHRGPLFAPKTMQAGSVLFGALIPSVDSQDLYSHAWGGMYPGDNFMDLIRSFADGVGVKEVIENTQ